MKNCLLAVMLLAGLVGCKPEYRQVRLEAIQGKRWAGAVDTIKLELVITPAAFIVYVDGKERRIPYRLLGQESVLLESDTIKLYVKDGRVLRIAPSPSVSAAESIDILYETEYLLQE